MEPVIPHLEFNNVSFEWPNGKKVLDKCFFSIKKSGLWMLVGKNGSGKSTLFRLISGVIKPQRGKIICSLSPSIVERTPSSFFKILE